MTESLPVSPAAAVAALLLALALACAAAFLRGYFTRRATASIRPATPHAGFATPDHLLHHLSEAAVRRAGEQVRPTLSPTTQGTPPS